MREIRYRCVARGCSANGRRFVPRKLKLLQRWVNARGVPGPPGLTSFSVDHSARDVHGLLRNIFSSTAHFLFSSSFIRAISGHLHPAELMPPERKVTASRFPVFSANRFDGRALSAIHPPHANFKITTAGVSAFLLIESSRPLGP